MSRTLKVLTVTDLHQVRSLYELLGKTVASHQPDIVALVGDFLDGVGGHADQLGTAECAAFLGRLPCKEVVFVRGNHEDSNWWEFLAAWQATGRPLHALHSSVFVHGPLVMVGFPCLMGDETAFVESLSNGVVRREDCEEDPLAWLPKVLLPHGAASRTLWLMHEPPAGTPLSKAGSAVGGNQEWGTAIEQYSPWLTISGHDHVTPRKSKRWHHRIGRTVTVNAGQTDSGPLHYCVIETEFAKATPSLPVRVRVEAWPYREVIALPA